MSSDIPISPIPNEPIQTPTPTERLEEAKDKLSQAADSAQEVVDQQLAHLENAYQATSPQTLKGRVKETLARSSSRKNIKREIKEVKQMKAKLDRAISEKKESDSVKVEDMISKIQDYVKTSVLREPLLTNANIDLKELTAKRGELGRNMGEYRQIISNIGLQLLGHGVSLSSEAENITGQNSRASSIFNEIFQKEKTTDEALETLKEAKNDSSDELKTKGLYADLKTGVEKFSRKEAKHKLHKEQYEHVEAFFKEVESRRDGMQTRLINLETSLEDKKNKIETDIQNIEKARGKEKEIAAKASMIKWMPMTKTRKKYKATKASIRSLEKQKSKKERTLQVIVRDLEATKAMIDEDIIGIDNNLGRLQQGSGEILAKAEKDIKKSLKGSDRKLEGRVSKTLQRGNKALDKLLTPTENFLEGINSRYKSHF